MTIYILGPSELHRLPEMLRLCGPDDCVQIPWALGGEVFNTFRMEDFGGKIKTNTSTIILHDITALTPALEQREEKPNRGPQGHIENWKRRGRKKGK